MASNKIKLNIKKIKNSKEYLKNIGSSLTLLTRSPINN
jgi:hypothetical protein